MVRLPVYEFCLQQGIDDYVHLRLSEEAHGEPGMVGLLLARANHQPAFNAHETHALSQVLPDLQAVARRHRRWEKHSAPADIYQVILESATREGFVLQQDGQVFWASAPARECLGLVPGEPAPAPLRDIVVRMGKSSPAVCHVALPTGRATGDITASLCLHITRSGRAYVWGELSEKFRRCLALRKVVTRYDLTPAEGTVLCWLAMGLSNKAIAARLFVAPSTVYTHVARIIGKLGVESRVQAALVARGLGAGDLDE
jgi:DNA-binding CsgD family transcriptional regulator